MFISVHDPEEALGFYRDALGLQVKNDVKSGDFRWVTVAAPGDAPAGRSAAPHSCRSIGVRLLI